MTKIFISHNKTDKPFARRLREELAKHEIDAWVDQFEINVGDSLINKISEGINECEFLAVVLSPDSESSEWVQREVNIALTEEIKGKKVKVLPILHRECNIPAFLSDKLYADFTYQFEAGMVSLLRAIGINVSDITLAIERVGPYVKEFSSDDWDEENKTNEFSISIPHMFHGKTAPSVVTQIREDNAWNDCMCSVSVTDEDDVIVFASSSFSGRLVIR